MRPIVAALILLAGGLALDVRADEPAEPKFTLRSGDRVIFAGATFLERDRHYGEFETVLRTRFPGTRVSFRNMAWPGDTTTVQLRPLNFGTFEENIRKQNPTVAIVSYGQSEAFGGPQRIDSFIAGYEALLDVIAETGARVVIVSPPPHEERSSPAADPSTHNRSLEQYVAATKELAARRGVPFVDVFHALKDEMNDPKAPPLTENGIHLSSYGYWRAAEVLAEQLGLPRPESSIRVSVADSSISASGSAADALSVSDREIAFNVKDEYLQLPLESKTPHAPTQTLAVAGLKRGKYRLTIDEAPVASATADEWARGVAIADGAMFDQARELRAETQWKNLLFFNRWRAHNGEYIYGRRAATSEGWSPDKDGGNAGNPTFPSEMAEFDRLIDLSERTASGLSIPATRRYKLTAE